MGGDQAPTCVVEGALLVAASSPDVEIVLVGPVALAERLLAQRGAVGRFALVEATQVVGMHEDPARAVRAKGDATVRTTHQLVRDGDCAAAVSLGSTGATLAAAVLELGRLVPRPALAVVVPAAGGDLVLLDVGARLDATPKLLCQHAVLGAALAQVALGLPAPRVGLLNVGEESGKGDQLRRDAFAALSDGPVRFVGNVEGQDVALGGKADVIVTDGFTGNVLLKGIEGANARAGGGQLPSAAVLLGVGGTSVIGHGAGTAQDVARCVLAAASWARAGLVERVAAVLDQQTKAVS